MNKQSIILGLSLISTLILTACQTTPVQNTPTLETPTGNSMTSTNINNSGNIQSTETGSTSTGSSTITISKPPSSDTTPANDDLIYRNEEYGFEITFPPEREGYTVYTYTEGTGKVGASFVFTFPTNSPYRWEEDPTTGERIPNIASIFAISIMDESQYKEATKYGGPGTPGLLGSKDGIYYTIEGANDLPEDVQNKIHWFSSPNTPGEQSSRSINKAFKIL